MRFTALVLALLIALAACGAETKAELPDLNPIAKAVEGFNGEDTRAVSFVLNISEEGKEESVFFSQGNASYRVSAPVAMSGRMTQIYKGAGTTADIYYKAGAYYRSDEESKYYLVMDRESFLKQFMCTDLPVVTADKVSTARVAETGAGTKYSLAAEIDRETLTNIFGDSLYSACSLKKPQRDKTAFDKIACDYVIGKNGGLISFKLTATAMVYDTPPYYPNYQVPSQELMRSFDLSYEISVKGFGAEVEIVVPNTDDFVFLS